MYMDERFGAWQVGEYQNKGRVCFKLFFPDRTKDSSQYGSTRKILTPDGGEKEEIIPDYGDPKILTIQVAGDFQQHLGQANWDFTAAPMLVKKEHAKGWIWTYETDIELPAGFYQYKYYVKFENGTLRKVGDPCTRYGGQDGETQNSGFVIGGSSPDQNKVSPLADGRKHLRDLIIYELMIADFTAEFQGTRAPLDAIRDKLDYLQTLGINAILFMPWTAWPGNGFNWGYTPFQYFSVEYRYTNTMLQPSEKISWLKRLITDCHERGIHVIMDGVFNHVGDMEASNGVADGFPYRWLYETPEQCPYVGTFGGTFAGLTDLDYSNGCTQEFIRDVCYYWIDNFKIDGIRFDNTTNFYINNRQSGLPMLIEDIRQHVGVAEQDIFSLTLEYLDLNAAKVTNVTKATSYWNDALFQCSRDYLWNGRIDSRIMNALNVSVGLDDGKVATSYIGNHDHAHVAWLAGARNNAGSLEWYKTQPYMIALFTCPATPLIQNGQEFGEDYWLMEDDQGTSRRVKPRPLRWDFVNDPIGSSLYKLYKQLIGIRKAHDALRSANFYPNSWEEWQTQFNPEGYGVNVQRQVVIYHRWGIGEDGGSERFIVVINFSSVSQLVDIPFSANGIWTDLLNNQPNTIGDYVLRDQEIESNWGRIYCQRD